ncbi:putative flavonol synthase protein [Eutypa lata UCREL1]|uniref:Putative flavonol synthase protein n=1 Tax=Eutypa lata (strain UCR-EL1) TaxID=1287681 RepID=M7SWF4_EUTLA|nr:putative flavonol synthase protein [Eutypa lata UCREL1]
MSPSRVIEDLPPYEYPNDTREIRFFYVTGHGFSDEEVKKQYALCGAVFDLPLEEKLKYACDTAKGDFRGYKPQSTGKLSVRDNDERYNIPKFTPEHERPHPQIILDHLDEVKEFSMKVHDRVLIPVLRLFAYVLEIDENYFVDRHRYDAPGLEYLRYMKYFPRSAEEDAQASNIWARGHTDYNTLTFLFHQPVAGLQVQTPEGRWKYVKSPRDAIIVNIADALEFLSGGYLKSTVHRVIRPPEDQADKPRLSLIYFARPEANIILKPVVSPLLQRLGLQCDIENFTHDVTAEDWARARIAKDHRFRTGQVDKPEKEIIAGVNQKYYD